MKQCKVKQDLISSITNFVYELPHELPNDVRLRGCLYEVRHLTQARRLTRVGYPSSRVYMRKASHPSEILFIPVSQHAYF